MPYFKYINSEHSGGQYVRLYRSADLWLSSDLPQ